MACEVQKVSLDLVLHFQTCSAIPSRACFSVALKILALQHQMFMEVAFRTLVYNTK